MALRDIEMTDKIPLMQPGECALLLVDLQAGLAFGVSSEDRQTLVHNAIALARTALVFGLPVIVSTSASKVYSGPSTGRARSWKRMGAATVSAWCTPAT